MTTSVADVRYNDHDDLVDPVQFGENLKSSKQNKEHLPRWSHVENALDILRFAFSASNKSDKFAREVRKIGRKKSTCINERADRDYDIGLTE